MMHQTLISMALSDLGRDALKVAAGLALALAIALAFALSSLATLLGPAPAGYKQAGASSNEIVEMARAQIGAPYVWGGASPKTSFDCSGLVQWVYGQNGVSLPRTAQQQFAATVRLAAEQLRPGDLVFFAGTYPSSDPITHVGIYVGGGRMINAPAEGDVVREMPVFTGYWGAHYAGAGRAGG